MIEYRTENMSDAEYAAIYAAAWAADRAAEVTLAAREACDVAHAAVMHTLGEPYDPAIHDDSYDGFDGDWDDHLAAVAAEEAAWVVQVDANRALAAALDTLTALTA